MISQLSPYDVLKAGKWHSALFTTFSLSLSFFEAVALHALRTGGARDIGILADIVGYRASLSEAGVADAGRSYNLVPLSVAGGRFFHPKIMVLVGEDGVRATVGSGNLTFGGWGHNIECIDYLAPEQAPEAFTDLARFFERLTAEAAHPGGRLVSDGPLGLGPTLDACRRAARGPGSGRIRVLHTYDGSIAEQLALHAMDLGGATEITVVSPFFGGPRPVRDLAVLLECERVRVCVTARAPEFFDFAGAEAAGLAAEPVRSDALAPASLLHAKVVEVTCRDGRLVLSGSVNATRPALIEPDNIEASVLRVVDERLSFGWMPADRPSLADGEGGAEGPVAGPCLTARFDGGRVSGRLFCVTAPGGSWAGRLSAGTVQLVIGDIQVEDDGAFSFSGEDRDFDPWRLTRATQLVLARGDREVRGWLVLDQLIGAVRERGHVAEAMIRALSGAEDPSDLTTIIGFFAENPEAFLDEDVGDPTTGTKGAAGGPGPASGRIDLDSLKPIDPFEGHHRAPSAGPGASAFERLLAAMRRHVRHAAAPKAATADAGDLETGDAISGDTLGTIPRWDVETAIDALTKHVETMRGSGADVRRQLVNLLDFILFAAERSDDPDGVKTVQVRRWLGTARTAHAARDGVDMLDRAFAAVATALGAHSGAAAVRAHGWLQAWCRGPVDVGWAAQAVPNARGLRERRLAGVMDGDAWEAAWRSLLATRTSWMAVHEIDLALSSQRILPDLPATLADELRLIARVAAGTARPDAVQRLRHRSDWPACPKCALSLPASARERLREHRIATAPCCGRVVLDPILD